MNYLDLASCSAARLTERMHEGGTPDPAALDGWEYRGTNTTPSMRLAGMDRFVKGFVAGDDGAWGYNRRVRRGSRHDPWLPGGRPDPEPFAFYTMAPVDPEAVDNRYLHALLLDYSAGATSRFDPAAPIRDYLVTLDDDHELLLGHAFLALGSKRVAVTHFVLERLRRSPDDVPERFPEPI